jgi:hypothetical protein
LNFYKINKRIDGLEDKIRIFEEGTRIQQLVFEELNILKKLFDDIEREKTDEEKTDEEKTNRDRTDGNKKYIHLFSNEEIYYNIRSANTEFINIPWYIKIKIFDNDTLLALNSAYNAYLSNFSSKHFPITTLHHNTTRPINDIVFDRIQLEYVKDKIEQAIKKLESFKRF